MTIGNQIRTLVVMNLLTSGYTDANCRRNARTFAIDFRSVQRIYKEYKDDGILHPVRYRQRKDSIGLPRIQCNFVLQLLAESPTLFVTEIVEVLYTTYNVRFAESQVNAALNWMHLTPKVLEW